MCVCVSVCVFCVVCCWHAFVPGGPREQINCSLMETLFSTQWGDSCIYEKSACASDRRVPRCLFREPLLNDSCPPICQYRRRLLYELQFVTSKHHFFFLLFPEYASALCRTFLACRISAGQESVSSADIPRSRLILFFFFFAAHALL